MSEHKLATEKELRLQLQRHATLFMRFLSREVGLGLSVAFSLVESDPVRAGAIAQLEVQSPSKKMQCDKRATSHL